MRVQAPDARLRPPGVLRRLRAACPDTATARRWSGDAGATALLVALLVHLAASDGGMDAGPRLQVALLAVAVSPALAGELRRLPRSAAALLGLWGLGGLASLAFALDRSGFVAPTLVLGLTPLVLLAALRLWRRRWGPPLLLGLLLIAFGRYWHRSFLQWWGEALLGRPAPEWLALSWRNQSGVLMGAFALLFAGAGLVLRGVASWALLLAGAAGLTGTWLSASRGSVVMTGVALVVTLGAVVAATPGARRTAVWRHMAVRLGALVAAAVGMVLTLTSMIGGGQPLAARADSAVGNGLARLGHMEAALGMFLDRPLTGQGLGAYRSTSRPFTPPDANLTASAHNEYLEVLGEGGLLLGVAVLGAVAGLAWLVVRSLRRHPSARPGGGDVRTALGVGAVGAVALLAVHAAVDFDWRYPVLPGMLAVGAAMLLAEHGHLRIPAGVRRTLALLPVVALLAVGVAGQVVADTHRRAGDGAAGVDAPALVRAAVPWDHEAGLSHALQLVQGGEPGHARRAWARTRAWNPGVENVRLMGLLLDYEDGARSASELVAAVGETRELATLLVLAGRLTVHGDTAGALELVEQVLEGTERYAAWGTTTTAVEAALLGAELIHGKRGCDAVEAWLARAAGRAPIAGSGPAVGVLEQALAAGCQRELSTAAGDEAPAGPPPGVGGVWAGPVGAGHDAGSSQYAPVRPRTARTVLPSRNRSVPSDQFSM